MCRQRHAANVSAANQDANVLAQVEHLLGPAGESRQRRDWSPSADTPTLTLVPNLGSAEKRKRDESPDEPSVKVGQLPFKASI